MPPKLHPGFSDQWRSPPALSSTPTKKKKKSFLTLLLKLCGDIERYPGPISITIFSKQRGIAFLHQNICGLLKKIRQLETCVSDTLLKIDIISFSETHISGDTGNDELYKMPGYTFLRTTEKRPWRWGWYLFEGWTELQTTGQSTKLSHRFNLA